MSKRMEPEKRSKLAKGKNESRASEALVTAEERAAQAAIKRAKLLSKVHKVLAGRRMGVLEVQDEVVTINSLDQPEQGQMQEQETNDNLIRAVLPVFHELAKVQKLTPFPTKPSAIEEELRQGLAEAEAAGQKRGPTP